MPKAAGTVAGHCLFVPPCDTDVVAMKALELVQKGQTHIPASCGKHQSDKM